MDRARQAGKVWLVGAGPGDPELVTVKAARVLGEADVWLIDDLVSPEIRRYARADAEIVYVGKRGGRCSTRQDSIHAMILSYALAGRTVARVKGGDPMLFGRGGEEMAFLQTHGVEVEVVSGITAGVAAAHALEVGLTHRAHCRGVTFVTAHAQDEAAPDWAALAASRTTLVLYMGMSRLADIRDGLLAAGLPADMPAAAVQSASQPGERRWIGTLATLEQAQAAGLASPAVILVGEVLGDSPLWPAGSVLACTA